MKARSQRVHHMGSSNRNDAAYETSQIVKTQSIFERSFNKSQSLHNSKLSEANSVISSVTANRANPFNGGHNQFETQRFDKQNIRPYKYAKMRIPAERRTLDFTGDLNKQIRDIQDEFKDKRVNLHKLNQLKQAFVKNNKDRRKLQAQFQKYASDGTIDLTGVKKMVKDYGFDATDDEVRLMLKLTHRANKTQGSNDTLSMDAFVELMTKEDIYYRTLKLSSGSQADITFGSAHFSQKVHEVLRNKFASLKQAFKIYRSRDEEIGRKQFDYVLKKLDLTDLVLTSEQRTVVYDKFADEKGLFNVQGLICAIAEQENNNKNYSKGRNQFEPNIEALEEKQFENSKKMRQFRLGNLSVIQYEDQFKKAQSVIDQLRKLKKNSLEILSPNQQFCSRNEVIAKIERLMKKSGINFHQDEYEALGAYLNYDINGCISAANMNQQLFLESEAQAKERFQRKVRCEAPKPTSSDQLLTVDHQSAATSIQRLKQNKMNPEARQLFKMFDQDKDGYISAPEFKEKLNQLNIMDEYEVENLLAYFQVHQQGSINFAQFARKISQVPADKEQNQLPVLPSRNSKSCSEWSQAIKNKKTFISSFNEPTYQRPTKFSAWPSHITEQDLSLLQPANNCGMYASEQHRFSDRKEDYGRNHKMLSINLTQNRIRKIAEWNSQLQERARVNLQKEEERKAANNFALRLAHEKYELNCHQ